MKTVQILFMRVIQGAGQTFTAEETNQLPGNGGNLSVDPVFEPPEGGGDPTGNPNPHLSPFSPLLDMATDVLSSTPLFLLNLPTDIDSLLDPPGDPRILGPRADIGADETLAQPTPTPSDTPATTPTATPTPTFTQVEPTATITPGGPTATLTPGGPTLTATPTLTPGGPTETPTPTNTPGGPTETATPTRTPIDCDLLPGNNPALNPRCDCFDLIALIEDRKGLPPNLDTDFDNDGAEDARDIFLFATHWYYTPQ